jgi:hypothetical protein
MEGDNDMHKTQSLQQSAIAALQSFEQLRDRFQEGRTAMNPALRADFAAWLEAASSDGPLRPDSVTSAKPLMARLGEEISATGGPFAYFAVGGEAHITGGSEAGERLSRVAQPGRHYLANACHVIQTLQAELAIQNLRAGFAIP